MLILQNNLTTVKVDGNILISCWISNETAVGYVQ